MIKFTATIYKIGINPVVDPPEKALQAIFRQAGRSKGPIPVRGKLKGVDFIQTLVKFKGAWRLYVNGPMLKDSRLSVGEVAKVEIEFDPRSREVALPSELESALSGDRKASAAFANLAPSRRKEISRYIGSLKSREAIEKNVKRVISHLRDEATDAQYALMRRKKN
jgi:hypothetical protein